MSKSSYHIYIFYFCCCRFQVLSCVTTNVTWEALTYSSVQFSCSVVSDSLQPRELQHARPPCPSPTPRVHPNSYPSSRWGHGNNFYVSRIVLTFISGISLVSIYLTHVVKDLSIFCSLFYLSLLQSILFFILLVWGLVCSSFTSSLSCKMKLLIWDLIY